MNDDMDIPDFLRRRKSDNAWLVPPVVSTPKPAKKKAPPPPPPPKVEVVATIEFEVLKKNKTEKRLSQMKANLDRNKIPPAFRRWDQRKSKWYDERIVSRQRMLAEAARLGITLENDDMDKLTIIPYSDDTIIERGRSSFPATAAEFEVQAKLVKSANRAGLKKITRLDLLNPDGSVRETWTVDFDNKLLQKVGAELTVPTTTTETENETMATTTKKKASGKKSAAKKTAKKKANGGAARGPGVIATIVETIKRDRGATHDEIIAVLTKKFPDRKEAAMLATVKIQANKNAKKKEKDDKRGLIYYG